MRHINNLCLAPPPQFPQPLVNLKDTSRQRLPASGQVAWREKDGSCAKLPLNPKP